LLPKFSSCSVLHAHTSLRRRRVSRSGIVSILSSFAVQSHRT
jgi:hypothetical protein